MMITTLIHHLDQGPSRIWSLYKGSCSFLVPPPARNSSPAGPRKGSVFLVTKIVRFRIPIGEAIRDSVLTAKDREICLSPTFD
jgi:hypothetical protein